MNTIPLRKRVVFAIGLAFPPLLLAALLAPWAGHLAVAFLGLAAWAAAFTVFKPSWILPMIEYADPYLRVVTDSVIKSAAAFLYWFGLAPIGAVLRLLRAARRQHPSSSYWSP